MTTAVEEEFSDSSLLGVLVLGGLRAQLGAVLPGDERGEGGGSPFASLCNGRANTAARHSSPGGLTDHPTPNRLPTKPPTWPTKCYGRTNICAVG
jgi:hypothetical protein